MFPGARIAGLLALLSTSFGVLAGSVWVRGGDQLHEIDAATNGLVRSFAVEGGDALAADAGGAWILARDKLLRHEANGAPAWSLDVAPLVGKPAFLSVDPRGHHLWVVGKDRLLRLAIADRSTTAHVFDGDKVRAVDTALDGSLWVLGNKELFHHSAQGVLLAAIDVRPMASSEPRLLVVDSLRDRIWLAGEKTVIGFDPASPSSTLVSITLPDKADAIALDAKRGTVWVVGNNRLHVLRPDGVIARSVDLKDSGLKDVVGLTFDPATESLWAIHKEGASRLNPEGALLATVPLAGKPEALAIAPLRLEPTVSILSPVDGLLSANASPPLVLRYGAGCSGAPCGFGFETLTGYQLSAILNGAPPGTPFSFNPLTGEATSVPAARLPEGANLLEASVADPFGNVSVPVASRFTIDTTAPRFIALNPADGSTVTSPSISISGSIDETATITLAGEGVSASVQGTSLSFPVTLRSGLNTFTLDASDAAGNRAAATIRVALASGVQVTVTSPPDGAIVAGSRVAVTGTFEGPANTGISINGVAATTFGNRFVAVIPLDPGVNPIAVTARSQDGATTSAHFAVSTGSAPPVEFDILPRAGIAPFTAEVRVPTIPDRISAQTQVDFDGDGVVDQTLYGFETAATFTYATPGIYNARITLNDYAGGYYTWTIPVVVQRVQDLDRKLQEIILGMISKLKAGDVEGALLAYDEGIVERYREIFQEIGLDLPAFARQLGTIVDGTVFGDFAEYVIVRDTPNGRRAFLVYLVLGQDGVWRIRQF